MAIECEHGSLARSCLICELEERVRGLERKLKICTDTLTWIAADNLSGGHLATDASEYMYGRAAVKCLDRLAGSEK